VTCLLTDSQASLPVPPYSSEQRPWALNVSRLSLATLGRPDFIATGAPPLVSIYLHPKHTFPLQLHSSLYQQSVSFASLWVAATFGLRVETQAKACAYLF